MHRSTALLLSFAMAACAGGTSSHMSSDLGATDIVGDGEGRSYSSLFGELDRTGLDAAGLYAAGEESGLAFRPDLFEAIYKCSALMTVFSGDLASEDAGAGDPAATVEATREGFADLVVFGGGVRGLPMDQVERLPESYASTVASLSRASSRRRTVYLEEARDCVSRY